MSPTISRVGGDPTWKVVSCYRELVRRSEHHCFVKVVGFSPHTSTPGLEGHGMKTELNYEVGVFVIHILRT